MDSFAPVSPGFPSPSPTGSSENRSAATLVRFLRPTSHQTKTRSGEMLTGSGETTSIWTGTERAAVFAPLAENVSADVCIVGAGIAGMMTAYNLAKAGRRVVVLDDGAVGSGETGRTTAHITAALDDRYYNIESMHGEDGARLAADSHLAALNRIEQICNVEEIVC